MATAAKKSTERKLMSAAPKALALVAIASFVCNIVAAQPKRTDLVTGPIGISLIIPEGFERFTEEQMARVHEKGVPAKFIFSDQKTDGLVVINTLGANASPSGLSGVEAGIKAAARKQLFFTERERNFVRINGRKWLRFSIQEGTGAAASISTYYITDWVGQYVLLTFSAPASKYEQLKKSFQQSAASVHLEMIVET